MTEYHCRCVIGRRMAEGQAKPGVMGLTKIDNALLRLAAFKQRKPAHSPDRGVFFGQIIDSAAAHIGPDQIAKLGTDQSEGRAALPVQFQD